MSDFKCKIEKNAIPVHRLIGKNKWDALKNKFNCNDEAPSNSKRNLASLDRIASNRQKEAQKIAEQYQAEAKANPKKKKKNKKK